ncbi:VP1 [Kummerowia striata gokushovirus]|nr:VP1 [Kummerowia striata gokushovirus]
MSINKSSMFTQAPFANVPGPQIQRSTFDRSKKYATTFDAGLLIPIFMEEVYSGDTSEMRPSHFVRFFSALKLPNFDNLYFETFWFYIRTRLLWERFPNFMGFQKDPGDSVDYTIPQVAIPSGGYIPGSLYNYMGWPSSNNADSWAGKTTNALPARAYGLTVDEWFRDENYVDSLDYGVGDGPDPSGYGVFVARRMKRPDRFTSLLPEPQKGPDVTLPISGTAGVYGIASPAYFDGYNPGGGGAFTNTRQFGTTNGTNPVLADTNVVADSRWNLSTKAHIDALGVPVPVYADLATATMANVNNIRLLFQIQKVYEKDMRGGTRMTEFYRVHFGVVVPDYTIQRPELLSTSSDRIMINPVAQTSESATTPQGTLTAFGVMPPSSGGSFTKSFDEHGYLMCLANIRADITYSQGLDKMWTRETRFDYYLPTFAHLGEEAVYQREMYVLPANLNAVDPTVVIGYQERWYDLRFPLNQYTGMFQPQVASNLAAYHLGEHFAGPVTVDDSFMSDNPPVDRIVAVTSENQFFVQSFFSHRMTRPMPMFSVPGLIDHF